MSKCSKCELKGYYLCHACAWRPMQRDERIALVWLLIAAGLIAFLIVGMLA